MYSTTQAQSLSNASGDNFISGLYLVKSWWNGRFREPVILEFAHGKFSMYDRNNQPVFSVPHAAVQAHFTVFGTLYLTINGSRYTLVASGRSNTPRFTPQQEARLKGRNHSAFLRLGGAAASLAGQALGRATNSVGAPAAGSLAAAVLDEVDLYKADKLMNHWRSLFSDLGVSTTGRKSKQVLYSILLSIVLLTAIAGFIFIGTR